jgi:predicted GNAT family acetyltransferase
LLLSRLPSNAVDALVADVAESLPTLGGVTGPVEEAEAFAERWTVQRGGRWSTHMRLKLHVLTEVEPNVAPCPGVLRSATDADVALAREWIDAYLRDAGLEPAADRDVAERMVRQALLSLWIDADVPRCMAATSRASGSGCSIYGVYTPPANRRRGYATATVAALSATLLARGRTFCCLYTDAANPTSNSIYAKIGYRPIRDEAEITFEP